MRKAIVVGGATLAVLVAGFTGAAAAKDRNHDHIPDRWEKRFHLSLAVNQANRDQDGDHINNLNEFRDGTNPRSSDSDGDGVPDNQENAGTIASFDGTTLVINLAVGGQLSGQVTANTRIECRTENEQENENEVEEHATASRDGSSGDGSGSGGANSGPGSSSDGSGDAGAACTMADLTPGTAVHEAELEGTTFDKVELIK
jgi:hypothetical protein